MYLFLVIGKTHPGVVKNEGEQYRNKLKSMVTELKLSSHVKFIDSYLALPELLEYLQLTDIYLFTSHDPNQAVSGTFAYAMSCACPIISTPIPHARESTHGGNRHYHRFSQFKAIVGRRDPVNGKRTLAKKFKH